LILNVLVLQASILQGRKEETDSLLTDLECMARTICVSVSGWVCHTLVDFITKISGNRLRLFFKSNIVLQWCFQRIQWVPTLLSNTDLSFEKRLLNGFPLWTNHKAGRKQHSIQSQYLNTAHQSIVILYGLIDCYHLLTELGLFSGLKLKKV
jgi:hypothetical protein